MTLMWACLLSCLVSWITGGSLRAQEAVTSRLRVVLVGVTNYAGQSGGLIRFADLPFAGNDVVKFRETLLRQGVPAERVVLLHEEASDPQRKPTFENVARTVGSLVTEPDDLLLFVFCGHGINIGRESYLCLNDTSISGNLETGDLLANRALSMQQLLSALEACDVAGRIVLADACRNYADDVSAYGHGEKLYRYDLTDHIRRMAAEGAGRQQIIISSCLPGQISLAEPARGHGLFMARLLDGLSGRADFEPAGNRDGQLSLYELFQFASNKTQADAEQQFGVRQHPFFEGSFTEDCVLLPIDPQIHLELLQKYDQGAFRERKQTYEEQLARERFRQALDALNFGDLPRVVELCEGSLELDGNYTEARRLMIAARRAQGDFKGAIADAKRLDSLLQVRVDTGPSALPIKDVTDFNRILIELRDGDAVELKAHSQPFGEYPEAAWLLVSRIRRKDQQQWEELEGWVAASELMPRSSGQQLELIREYQQSSGRAPVSQGQQAGWSQRNLTANRIAYSPAATRVETAIETANRVQGIVGSVRSRDAAGVLQQLNADPRAVNAARFIQRFIP